MRSIIPHNKQQGGVLCGLFGKGAAKTATGLYAEKAGLTVSF
jgi:hypothetical protein